jgi:hypothetical protein
VRKGLCFGALIGALLLAHMLISAADGSFVPGTISTLAGGGIGDGGPPLPAVVDHPWGLAISAGNDIFIVEANPCRVRKVSAGVISTIAGNGVCGFNGDGPATESSLDFPTSVAVDAVGIVYIADRDNCRIRKVSNGVMTTIAGTGPHFPGCSFGGDNGTATDAQLNSPYGVAIGPDGSVYVADTNNCRIRRIVAGVITTFAGSGICGGPPNDGGLATNANLFDPRDVTVDSGGNVYVYDRWHR